MYPAFSSYLAQTSDRRPRTAFSVSHPADGPTYEAPSSVEPTPGSEGKGRHRAAVSLRRQPRLRALPRSRHGATRPRRSTPQLSYGYASAALLTLTAALLAQSHGPASVRPQAAPPAQQPDVPHHSPPPAPDQAPATPDPPARPTPHPSVPADTDTPPDRWRKPATSTSSVLHVGNTGSSVRQLQEQLGQLRLYTGPVDGYYSHDVAAAVARVQQARAISEPLGVYGPSTRAALRTAAM